MKTKICAYCKRTHPLKEFRTKESKLISSHCKTCKNIINEKDIEERESLRDLTSNEVKMQKKFIKSLKAKEKREKLNITKGKI